MDTFPVDLPYQSHLWHNRKLGNQAPDGKGARPLPSHPSTNVQMKGERGYPVAHNPDPFKTEPPLSRSRRRQQRSHLYCDAHTLLLLEDALLHDRLQEQAWIDKLGPCIRRLLDASLTDELEVLRETVI